MNFEQGRREFDLCSNWRFIKGEQQFAQYDSFDDSAWKTVCVPHDWTIEGPFSLDDPSGARAAYLPCGIGWYRKTFKTPENAENSLIELEFDGIFRCATVYVNGIKVGFRPYGYVPQCYDISNLLYHDGKENLIAVRVDNSDQPGHRYYSGSGIYREVRLIVREKLHIEHFAPFIITESADQNNAVIGIETTVKNAGESAACFKLGYEFFDAQGKLVCRKESENGIAYENSRTVIKDTINLSKPQLWSPETPYLYTLKTVLYGEDVICDTSVERVGVRTIEFDDKNGFILNGKKTFMYGVCLHHDNGALGGITNNSAERRKLLIMKEMGCNAIRLSHNPFSRGFYELCDEMGFLVMDEAFDEWRMPKFPIAMHPDEPECRDIIRNYYTYFDEWHKADIEAMLYRDRNHPSIVIWSIGNEIKEQRENIFEANATAAMLRDIVKAIDTTRPVTCATIGLASKGVRGRAFADALDVIGYNYVSEYEKLESIYPNRPYIATETTSHPPFKKRGFYDPHTFTFKQEDGSFSGEGEVLVDSDAYRMNRAESIWMRHKNNNAVAGLFIWTGMDYLGEPTPHLWPSRSSYFAPVDTCGFKKDSFYYYQAEWSSKPVVHIAGHWNWKNRTGEPIDITVFTNCDTVELFLNEKSQGVRHYDDKLCKHLYWVVPYSEGKLTAIGYKNGKKVAEHTLITTDEPYAVHISADRDCISENGKDLCFITAKVVDKNGLTVPTADCNIKFNVSAGLKLCAVDNGDPEYIGNLQANNIPALSGMCLCIVGAKGEKGEFTVSAMSEGLESDEIRISVV